MLRILIDGQAFSIHRRGGIGRVFASVFEEFLQLPQDHETGIKLSLGVLLTKYSDSSSKRKWLPLYMHGHLSSSKLALLTNWLFLWLHPYKIVHSTYYFRSYLIRRPGTKHVVTLHDMIPEDFPQYFEYSNPHRQKEKFLRNADRIVCVSNYTLSRLAHHHPDLIHKASFIPPGVKQSTQKSRPKQQNSQLLYVGKRGGYKDFMTLLKSLPPLIKSDSKLQVLAVSSDKFSSAECALIEELGLAGRVIQKELSDMELEVAYRGCMAVVVTSHVEGFGLPIIEAMAHGALVIATDIPVFNEIAGGAFLSFAPGDFSALTSLLQDVLVDPEAFEENRDQGLIIAKRYTWRRTLDDLSALYREIGNSGNRF